MLAEGGLRWRAAIITVTDMARGECTVLLAAEEDGRCEEVPGEGFVEAVLTKAASRQRSVCGPADSSARTSGGSDANATGDGTPMCGYSLKLHMRPGAAGWRGHLLLDLEGDRAPFHTGQAVRCATAEGRLPLLATLDRVPDVRELQAVHLGVLQADGGAGLDGGGMLEGVTAENTATGAVYHCELHRRAPHRPHPHAHAGFGRGDGCQQR